MRLPEFITGNKKKVSKAITAFELVHEGQIYEILLTRNKRSKRMTLRQDITKGKFRVTIPVRVTIAQAKYFCMQHITWIAEQTSSNANAKRFEHGQKIPLRGQEVTLVFHDKLRGQTNLLGSDLNVMGGTQHAPRRLTSWLKEQAKQDILASIAKYEPLLGVRHSKLTIRDTKTRWGSCSSTKALSFSWRLVFAPNNVLDYVVAHELAHILEMNHSSKFWAHVEKICPHMQESKQWLKLNGGQLHQIHIK